MRLQASSREGLARRPLRVAAIGLLRSIVPGRVLRVGKLTRSGAASAAPAATATAAHELDPRSASDHLDRLYRAAWALCGSREDAEDLVQETYLRVLARPRVLRERDDLGYLLRTLRNTFLDQVRVRGRRPVAAPVALEDRDPADPRDNLRPENALQARELFAVIAALPPDFRDVLVAVDVGGLSYKEAAAALRVRTGTVMSRLYRARERVATTLSLEGIKPAVQTS